MSRAELKLYERSILSYKRYCPKELNLGVAKYKVFTVNYTRVDIEFFFFNDYYFRTLHIHCIGNKEEKLNFRNEINYIFNFQFFLLCEIKVNYLST